MRFGHLRKPNGITASCPQPSRWSRRARRARRTARRRAGSACTAPRTPAPRCARWPPPAWRGARAPPQTTRTRPLSTGICDYSTVLGPPWVRLMVSGYRSRWTPPASASRPYLLTFLRRPTPNFKQYILLCPISEKCEILRRLNFFLRLNFLFLNL